MSPQSLSHSVAQSLRSFDTPVGRMAVVATERGLARVYLPKELATGGVSRMRGGMPAPPLRGHAAGAGEHTCPRERRRGHAIRARAERHAARAEREICQYLAGRRRRFTVPLDMTAVAPFHKRALLACRRTAYGKVLTYAQLAERSGRPNAARAAGQAMARNPLALVVPCHRVIATAGGLGGYGGGLDLKRHLLNLERAMA